MAPRDGAAENAVPLHARLARSSCASHPPRPRPLASTRCVLARPAPPRPAPPAPRLRARGCAAPRYMLPLWQRGSHLWWRSHGARWRPFLSNNGHLGCVLQSPTWRSREWIRIWIRFGRVWKSTHVKIAVGETGEENANVPQKRSYARRNAGALTQVTTILPAAWSAEGTSTL